MTAGLARISSGRPSASTLPSAMTMTRAHSDMTNSMLCSMTTKVARFSRLIAARRLVEQDEARPAHEGHRGVEQLLLAVGQAAGRLAGETVELEEPHHLVG